MKADSSARCGEIAQAREEGAPLRRQLAWQFRLSVALIQTLLRRRRLIGNLAAAVHPRGRCSVFDVEALALVASLSRARHTLTLAALCKRMAAEHRVHVSLLTM